MSDTPRPPGRKDREALVSAEGNTVHLVLPSDVTVDTMDAFAQANKELLNAVAEEMGLPPEVKFEVGGFRVVCDGCGIERPSPHDDWVQTETGHDYCGACRTHECDPEHPCEPNDHLCKNYRPAA